MNAKIIANTVFEIIQGALSKSRVTGHQCFRIKNLSEEEICQLVAVWEARADGTVLAAVRLIVAEDLGGRIPEAYVAEPGRSITFYRNHNEAGLVYLETKVQSDEQGLQNIFTLRDSNFLDGSFDEYSSDRDGVLGLLLLNAWNLVSHAGERMPSLLRDRVRYVVRLIHPDVEPVPVRRFVSFALELCGRWASSAVAKDAQVADRLVGECLFYLNMFPDHAWNQGHSAARVKRRLELNARHAELVSGGSDLDPDQVVRAASETTFLDDDGQPFSAEQQASYADACARYAAAPTDELRQRIPYTVFEQLFRKDVAGLKLGERVRLEVEEVAPSRLHELNDADVVQGLNARLQGDAERFLNHPAPPGEQRLADLLSARTRKAIERVAAPPAMRFSNPLVQLVRMVRQYRSDEGETNAARLHVECAVSREAAGCSLGLFAFVYGPTLKSLAEATHGVPGACEVTIAEELVTQVSPPPLVVAREDDSGDDGAGPLIWPPLSLKISAFDPADKLIECHDPVEWVPEDMPRLAFFWLLCCAEDSPAWSAVGELIVPHPGESDDWLAAFVQRDQSLDMLMFSESAVYRGFASVSDLLLDYKAALRSELQLSGLAIDALREYVAAWSRVLADVRISHVPEGTRPRILEAFLGSDILVFEGGTHRLMLPLQALRLRWLASYLQRCLDLALRCMTDTASFATGDGGQYLDLLESLSPHETPPTALGRSGEILHARSEAAWFESFAPLVTLAADVSVDHLALASIAARITDYIDAHPFKRDGLSVLLLLPSSDAMPAELIDQITKGPYSDLRLSLTVAAPKSRWERIARRVETLPGEERKSSRGRLFPARDLAFIEFDQGGNIDDALEGHGFDLAIVTHVLQEGVLSQQNTEPPSVGRFGAFDPVLDRPVRLEPAGSGGAISIVMLPRAPDIELESWGTLVVRGNRSCPVSPSQPENIDFVELRVNFQDSARVFHALHRRSHWVVTLERHISREQIESVEAGAPDVLSVETGIGSNGLSTLIVSSQSGRALIEARLAKKLRKLLTVSGGSTSYDGTLEQLASRVYEETRKLSPHLALQAMGVARVTEEILGLCIARRCAEEFFPEPEVDGLHAWLSLDEHTGWFGGSTNVRADMCRVVIERCPDGRLDVDILVIEGKFRQNYDPHGTTQVARTATFFSHILAGAEAEGGGHVDAEMWRERFLSAIESVSEEAIYVSGKGDAQSRASRDVPADIRQLFREGNYRLRSVKGLYSICLWETAEENILREERDSVTVLRSSRAHIFDLIGRSSHRAEFPKRDLDDHEQEGLGLAPGISQRAIDDEAGTAGLGNSHAGRQLTGQEPARDVSEDSPERDDGVASKAGIIRHKGMSQQALSAMYDEILGCFASHKIGVAAASNSDLPIIEGPASILFKVRAGSGIDPRKLFEKAQALKLTLELDQDQNVSFDIDKGYVTIDVPKKSYQRYFVDASDVWARWTRVTSDLCVPLGEDRYGNLVSINFSSPNSPHLLVAGTTGSGKSEALNTMLYGLVKHYSSAELRMMLVDPKGTELLPFEHAPHLIGPIGWDDADALELLKRAVSEMQRRYDLFKSLRCKSLAEYNATVQADAKLPWWVIVLDEYADLTHDAQSKKEIEHELKRLAQKARASGIHVIIATQKPSAEVISTNLRANLPAQLALRVKSGIESRVVLDEQGAENLNGKGDALLKADGKLVRLQCARVDPLYGGLGGAVNGGAPQ